MTSHRHPSLNHWDSPLKKGLLLSSMSGVERGGTGSERAGVLGSASQLESGSTRS